MQRTSLPGSSSPLFGLIFLIQTSLNEPLGAGGSLVVGRGRFGFIARCVGRLKSGNRELALVRRESVLFACSVTAHGCVICF